MKFVQEFVVAENAETLWAFFERPDQVAQCMPGVEQIEVIDQDTFKVLVTQRVGPISATFESKVRIIEKIEGCSIGFTATGRAVRGAVGNFRSESIVRLHPEGADTRISVDCEAALAGILGSIGQKVIAKQAEKLAGEFAHNLQQRLMGGGENYQPTAAAPRKIGTGARVASTVAAPSYGPVVSNGWSKVAAALAAANVALSLVIISVLL
ncbi:CoxG family protein [Limibacillus halophilus]|uniref:Carbon monoxide dehydrogenase subunit G n=1 Tax=Limibacillus halophilus TaxID=1579333 RepID=A0A839SPX6_9PROT|nr:SRPBCC domain-containing protein [Limibacillus halophilus]MBB3064502.1 hypothetical protein [Limibacillus halophilus]